VSDFRTSSGASQVVVAGASPLLAAVNGENQTVAR